jgi:hypothetical protein
MLLVLAPEIQLILNAQESISMKQVAFHVEEVLSIPQVHAQTSTFDKTAMKFFGGLLQVFVVVNWLALTMVQALLSPEVIFGEFIPGFGRPMELILRNLWVTSRNIVNSLFLFILLFAGIYMIVMGGDGMQKVKSGMPKFVLAVILVNFSWFFPRVILDVSNVLTAVIFRIPELVTGGVSPCVRDLGSDDAIGGVGAAADEPCVYVYEVRLFPTMNDCKTTVAFAAGLPPPGPLPAKCRRPIDIPGTGFPYWGKSIGAGGAGGAAPKGGLLDIFYLDWNTVVRAGGFNDVNGNAIPLTGADTIINGLAVNFAQLPNLSTIDLKAVALAKKGGASTPELLAAYAKFVIELILHAALAIATGLALLAFAVVLVVRIAVLWLCIAFMPFIFVGWAMGGSLGDMKAEGAPNIWKTFIQYAFIPPMVAIPFAIGYAMMSNLYYVKAFRVALELDGAGFFVPGIDSFHEFLWTIVAIGIIWIGTFTVMKKAQFAEKLVSGIKGIGDMGVKTAVNAVGYAPMPLPGGGHFSAFGARDKLRQASQGDPGIALGYAPGSGGGGGSATPLSNKKMGEALEGKNLAPLNTILSNTNAGNAEAQRKAFINELHNASGGKISKAQAGAIAKDPIAMRRLVDASGGKINHAIANSAVTHFKGGVGGNIITGFTAVEASRMNTADIVAKFKEEAGKTPGITNEQITAGINKLRGLSGAADVAVTQLNALGPDAIRGGGGGAP